MPPMRPSTMHDLLNDTDYGQAGICETCHCLSCEGCICETCENQLEDGEVRFCQDCDPTQELAARIADDELTLYRLTEPKICPCCGTRCETVRGTMSYSQSPVALECRNCLHVLGMLEGS